MNKIQDIFKVYNNNSSEIYNEYINEEKTNKYKYIVYNNCKLNLKYSNKFNIKKNTIIIVSEGKYSGKIIYLEENALVYGSAFYILKLLDNIDIEINMKYIYYFLKYIDFKKYMNENKRNKILLSTIKNLNVPNISINKQNEIIELFDKLYNKYDIDYLNYQYYNYDIFNYLAENNLLLFEEVYKVEDTINKQKENNDIIIQSFIKNLYFNMFKNLQQKDIFVKKLKSLYLLQNKIKPDNLYHIIIYYDDINDDVIIKKINYNMEVKQKVIILSKRDKKFNDNIIDDYILYYLKIMKDEIYKHIDNLNNLKSILNDFDIPTIPLINQNDLIFNINNNLLSINTNIKSYIIDEILIKRLLQLNKNVFINSNDNDDNIFITEYEPTPALSPK